MDKFNLTFYGEILEGFELTEVKKHFAAALLINDPERIELIFSGKAVIIRRNIDKDTATALYTKMYRLGAVLKLEPSRLKPFDESSKPGIQHGFRKERPGSVDQSWPIPSSNPKAKKTPPPPIDKPGNAVKEAQETERKQVLEENKRLREEESARIDAEKKRLHEDEVARIEAEQQQLEAQKEAKRKAEQLAASKREAEEAAAVKAEKRRKRDEEAARVKAEKKRVKAEETAKRKALALAEKKRAAEEAAKTRAEEKHQRDEEAARVKAEQKRIKTEEAAKRKAEALEAKKRAAEEAEKIRAEEKRQRDEEAARVKAEQKRIKTEEAAKRKAEALEAKKRAAEETARALAEQERKREEEAARAQIEEEARLTAEKERMLALEIAREEAEKAALREQTTAFNAKKKANEERAIQAALDEIARKKAEEEAAIQQAFEREARKHAKDEEAKLRAELAVKKRKNAQEAARAKADEERIEVALRALATQRKNEENNHNLSLKENQKRQLELEQSHKTQQRLAQEQAAELRAQERLMEQEALQRAAAGTARLEELQRTSQTDTESATPGKTHKAPPRKPEPTAPIAKKVSPTSTIPPALTGGRRQSGEPNLFNLKPFRNTAEIRQRAAASLQLMKVMYIASVASLLTLLILGARYTLLPAPGPTVTHADKIIANQQSSLFVAAGGELFVLDRSGTDSNRYRFADLGIDSGATLLAFDNSGRLLIQTKAAAGTEASSNTTRLLRCDLQVPTCETFAAALPNGKISDWTTDTRTGDSFVAIAGEDSLSRLAQDGSLISQQTVIMSSGAKLIFHEGLLYMNSSTDPAIGVFRPDAKGFGEQLDDILLLPQQAQEQGHTLVTDFLWSADSWWVILSNPDTHSSALYRFDADWKFLSRIIMEPKSVPQQLLAWSNKILVVERTGVDIARFNSDGQAELPLTPKALASDITLKQDSLIQSRRLWYACLGFLALLGIVTYVLGRLHQLRALVYRQDNVRGAEPIDDKVKAIHWIDLDHRKMPAFKQIGILLAATSILVIGTLIYLIAPINVVMAVVILFSGPAIALALLATSRPGHVGVLEDSLILVDHNNNYHIDHGARIHYRNNFLLLDDIAVYVGNKLLPVFSTEQLAQNIAPLARAGVKVDRKTVLVKLGQNSHPLSRGLIACAAALGGALFCLLLY